MLSFVGQTLRGFQILRTSKVGLTRGTFIKKSQESQRKTIFYWLIQKTQ